MKYKVTEIKEDDEILEGRLGTEVARKMGCSQTYISLLRTGKRIATEDFYNKLKMVLDK